MTGHVDTLHVAAAIIKRGDTILAAMRGDDPLSDRWEFPAGEVEKGETPEEALRREAIEGLGCSLATTWPLDVVEHAGPDDHLLKHFYVCTLADEEEPDARKYRELRWLAAGELLDVDWLPADRRVVVELGMGWSEIFSESRF